MLEKCVVLSGLYHPCRNCKILNYFFSAYYNVVIKLAAIPVT